MSKIINLSCPYIFFNKLLSILFLFLLTPVIIVITLFIKITSKGPVIFKQERLGHNKRKFFIYKFRTMVEDAEVMKDKYTHMNYSSGPTFKIENDPRFTSIGKLLSDSHLDEIPQLFNVIKGNMLLVGFRPPIAEEVKKYSTNSIQRFRGYPGITSIWAVNGGHKKFSFTQWIDSDIKYEKRRGVIEDFKLILKTIELFIYIN
ncbi:MAG: sugar transferase [Nanoarchaeota archaeon]|nr:sugar transferase [Nanoarchaeota archaeon]